MASTIKFKVKYNNKADVVDDVVYHLDTGSAVNWFKVPEPIYSQNERTFQPNYDPHLPNFVYNLICNTLEL